ncbi:hypothetical protein PSN45_002736 [Yamadazyma tenuis]|uniref:uncharacterized protein n=1 Tax=Candida tenuis TaxID=2315449 RepID=UPI0027A42EEF|nr:hypothetical protein PSN45_002736 [Yamadazyma tenuis]
MSDLDTATSPSERGEPDGQHPKIETTGHDTDVESEVKNPSDSPEIDGTSTNPAPESIDSSQLDRKPKKKRLTLQERLALATKSKEASKRSDKKPAEVVRLDYVSTPESIPASTTPEPAFSETTTPYARSPEPQSVVSEELNTLKKENERLKVEIAKLHRSSASEELTRKDELINQLMKEGEQLSIKELKLNETIKKLKTLNLDYETVIEEFNTKNEENASIISEIDEILRRYKIKDLDELGQNIKEYKRVKAENIESKLKQSESQIDQETKLKNEKIKEANDLKIQLDLVKQSHQIELNATDEIVSNLKFEIKKLNSLNAQEIMRLENKIETLILENEDSGISKKNGTRSGDYEKLFKSYSNLQNEILNSRSNWELIEINLNSKINELNTKVDNLKKDKLNLINENKNLRFKMNEYDLRLNQQSDELIKYKSGVTKHQQQQDQFTSEKKSLYEKLEKMNQIFNNEKLALTSRIKELQLQIEEMEEARDEKDQIINQSMGIADHIDPPHISMDSSLYHTNNYSSQSLTSFDFEESSNIQNSSMLVSNQPSSFQLINKMSSSIRNLKVELNSLKDENEEVLQEKYDLESKILLMSKDLSKVEELKSKIEQLQSELATRAEKEDSLLVLLGEKEERVDELLNDVSDLKDLCKLQVQQMIEVQEKYQQ